MNILITGCAGTLGRAFSKLLKDHQLVGYDNSEWALAEYQKDFPNVKTYLEDFVEWKYDQEPVDLVIHCAAYKHVNLGEENINSFIDNNIIKTRKLFAEAFKNNADILFISTDKAVEPCSLYGYTKVIGEKLAELYNGKIVRLGNILSSNGSVIPIWEKAIKEGKPIPITDVKMKRFVIDVDLAVKQIWEGYKVDERLIIPECTQVDLMNLLAQVCKKHNIKKPKVEIIGKRAGEKLEEKLRWEWEV